MESTPPPETRSCSVRISAPHRPSSKTATCSHSHNNSRSSSTIHSTTLCVITAATPRSGKYLPRLAASRSRPGKRELRRHHIATDYFLLEPTNTNPKNNIPASKAFVAHVGGATYHLQNVALLPWYTGISEGLGNTYSFPDPQALTAPAKPCPPVTGGLSNTPNPQSQQLLSADRLTDITLSATGPGGVPAPRCLTAVGPHPRSLR